MDVIEFGYAIVAHDDGMVVVALFDRARARCVAILKGSPDAIRALCREAGSILNKPTE